MRFLLFLVIALNLSGCSSLQQHIDKAESLAEEHGFSRKIIPGTKFDILSFYKINKPSSSVTLFIEGDGKAWINKTRISSNPTPTNPVGLKLALNDPSANIVYLARPCQYTVNQSNDSCHYRYWTSERTSEEIIVAINDALLLLKKEFSIQTFRLVGYSGGGTIATILAARRDDVHDLRTVAGNLDIAQFSQTHSVSPLTGSINPIKYANKLTSIPQIHYTSRYDEIITRDITNSYINALTKYDPELHCVDVIETGAPSHNSGWETYWRMQKHTPIQCSK